MNHFIIEQASGEILTNAILDYESVRSYRITVVASDIGEPQRSRYALQYNLDNVNQTCHSLKSLFE